MTTMRRAALALAAVALVAVAGCAGSAASSSRPGLVQSADRVTLTCRSELPNATLAADIALLAADDKAIGGNWATAETDATGDEDDMTRPTAAQTKAADDLASARRDLTAAAAANGPVASAAAALDDAASALTAGTPTAQEGAAVHAGITALQRTCGITAVSSVDRGRPTS